MHWEDLEGSGGEGGGRGIRMGNTCKPMAVSFQCMTKSTTIKIIIIKKKKLTLLNIIYQAGNIEFHQFYQKCPFSVPGSNLGSSIAFNCHNSPLIYTFWDFPCLSGLWHILDSGDPGSVPGLGRSSGKGIGYPFQYSWDSLVAQLVKNPPAMQEAWFQSLGW